MFQDKLNMKLWSLACFLVDIERKLSFISVKPPFTPGSQNKLWRNFETKSILNGSSLQEKEEETFNIVVCFCGEKRVSFWPHVVQKFKRILFMVFGLHSNQMWPGCNISAYVHGAHTNIRTMFNNVMNNHLRILNASYEVE